MVVRPRAIPGGSLLYQASAPPAARRAWQTELEANAAHGRCSAARDVTPTLRAQGCRTYLFLEDGRMGRLSVTDAERLQVGSRPSRSAHWGHRRRCPARALGRVKAWQPSRSSVAAASDQCTCAAL